MNGIGKVRDKPGIFVVRMGGDIEGRPEEIEFLKIVVQLNGARGLWGLPIKRSRN